MTTQFITRVMSKSIFLTRLEQIALGQMRAMTAEDVDKIERLERLIPETEALVGSDSEAVAELLIQYAAVLRATHTRLIDAANAEARAKLIRSNRAIPSLSGPAPKLTSVDNGPHRMHTTFRVGMFLIFPFVAFILIMGGIVIVIAIGNVAGGDVSQQLAPATSDTPTFVGHEFDGVSEGYMLPLFTDAAAAAEYTATKAKNDRYGEDELRNQRRLRWISGPARIVILEDGGELVRLRVITERGIRESRYDHPSGLTFKSMLNLPK